MGALPYITAGHHRCPDPHAVGLGAPAPSAFRPAVAARLTAGPSQTGAHEDIDDHRRRLGRRPEGGHWLIDVLQESGLRGRGGAWFPTWRKWEGVTRQARGDAVVVVNASEGEPLSQKDGMLIALRPHLVLDGAALAAETLGARDIVVYLSRGRDGLDRRLQRALKERKRAGLQEPHIRIVQTAHRYVAGESSAVVRRLSGGPSKPKFVLRRAADRGVDGRPTLIQNAETLAHVAMIARFGADWFRRVGTQSSPGSALMTVVGNVRRPGVYEVDLTARLGGVIAAAGGTTTPPAGALLGGYFGTWLSPASLKELQLDVDTLKQQGASFGCGVLTILPQGGCGLVEAARIFRYLAEETAGQCGPCVNGLAAIAETMDLIAVSDAEPNDIKRVRRWIDMVRGRGACHHPDGAVSMLASALVVFKEHLESHLSGWRCDGALVDGFPRPPTPVSGWR